MSGLDIMARFRVLRPGMELTLRRRLAQPIARVFAALSTPDRIADWMSVTWTGDAAPLEVGSRFAYRFQSPDMATEGRVTRLEAPRLIEHTWFENLPPAATVRWALESDGDGCTLTLTQTYPGKDDDAARSGAGWTMIIGQLDAWLAGAPFKPPSSWRELRDRYAGQMGPEAVRDGRRLSVDGKPVVQFKRVIDHPVAQVWSWLTQPDRLKDWLGDVDVDLRPGGAYRIRFTMAPIVMDGTLTEVEPPHRLALIWREPWFKGDDVSLAYDLEPFGDDACLLTLTHTFPAGYDPHDYLPGWHDFLDALEEAVAGRPHDCQPTPERQLAYQTRVKVYQAIATAGG